MYELSFLVSITISNIISNIRNATNACHSKIRINSKQYYNKRIWPTGASQSPIENKTQTMFSENAMQILSFSLSPSKKRSSYYNFVQEIEFMSTRCKS